MDDPEIAENQIWKCLLAPALLRQGRYVQVEKTSLRKLSPFVQKGGQTPGIRQFQGSHL